MEALDKLRGNYTKESLLALETAMKSALEILNNENATRLQIIRADKNLENLEEIRFEKIKIKI